MKKVSRVCFHAPLKSRKKVKSHKYQKKFHCQWKNLIVLTHYWNHLKIIKKSHNNRISFIYNKKNLVKFGFMITKTCKKMKKPQKSKEASLSMDKFNQVFFHVSLKPRKMIKKKVTKIKRTFIVNGEIWSSLF